MSWVPLISDEQASPAVKRIYDYIRERWSFVPNYFRALGHDTQLLQDQTNLYANAMFDDRGLPLATRSKWLGKYGGDEGFYSLRSSKNGGTRPTDFWADCRQPFHQHF